MKPVILSLVTQRFLNFIIFLFIPLSILAPHSIVWEIVIAGLIGLYYNYKQRLYVLPRYLVMVLFAIPVWGLVTSLWSINPTASFLASLKILSLVTFGLAWCRLSLSLSEESQKSLIKAFLGGLFFGLLLLSAEIILGNPWRIFWGKTPSKAFAQGSLMISLAAWPALYWMWERPYSKPVRFGLILSLFFLLFWSLFQIDCDTSFVGLFLGICTFCCTFFFPRITSLGMRLGVPLFIIFFPIISLNVFKQENIPTINTYTRSSSYIDRIYIWNEVATSILEHPWKGIGMDGTPHHEKSHMIREWTFIDQRGVTQKKQSPRFALHPHNAILQLWLELGFLGVILAILLTHFTLNQIYRTNLVVTEKAICAGLFTGVFTIVWVNLGFWQSWWISGLWIIIGLTTTLFKRKREAYERVFT
ncbi:MAG: O-antigen ligase family protein [Alphaproteobacteria bacterium]|nr:O-antigen ligase family protein [Alphaproteobacteria bacterium]